MLISCSNCIEKIKLLKNFFIILFSQIHINIFNYDEETNFNCTSLLQLVENFCNNADFF